MFFEFWYATRVEEMLLRLLFTCIATHVIISQHFSPVKLTASEVVAEAMDIACYSQSLRSWDTRQPQLARNAGQECAYGPNRCMAEIICERRGEKGGESLLES
jgi:hypothetical protein